MTDAKNIKGMTTGYDDYIEREQRYQRKALELMRGQSKYSNIAPIIDLVRMADSHGLELVKAEECRYE